MDKKSRQLPMAEMKIYHCTHHVFGPYEPPPAVHTNEPEKETPQSVTNWQHYLTRSKLTSLSTYKRTKRNKIYIYLIGLFPDLFFDCDGMFSKKLCDILVNFVEAFFPGMTVQFVKEVVDHREMKCRTRTHAKSRQTQLFLPDVNLFLCQHCPKDAFCVCGFSWFDFYPSDELNHILGEGSFHNGTVAFSFGHYSKFKEKQAKQREWEEDFVVEPTIEIDDTLNKREGQQAQSSNRSFVYVTYSEKQEAEKRVSESEKICASSPKRAKRRKTSRPVDSTNSSPNGSTSRDIRELNDADSLVFSMSEVSMSGICEPQLHEGSRSLYTDCGETEDETSSDGWDMCNDISKSAAVGNIDAERDRLLRTALPTGTEFTLNCKIVRRLLRVMSHEICHVMGMMHCQYNNCTLNASTSILDVDEQALFLCPVCLRKLQLFLKCDLLERYKQLDGFLLQYNELECTCNSSLERKVDHLNTENCRLKDDLLFLRKVIDFVT